ncbi:MAG: YdcH family protein [Paracoccaceae bacterium]
MSHVPYELAEEFPDKAEKVHALKEGDAHFRKLLDANHDINRAIHRAETNVEPTDPLNETGMRKKRMVLKDQIAWMLAWPQSTFCTYACHTLAIRLFPSSG